MTRKTFITFMAVLLCITTHAISPDSCSVAHRDSCWYITMNYNIDKIPSNDELIMTSLLCSPDTCIGDTTRHFQGRKYTRRFKRKYGYTPQVTVHGPHSCTIVLPEDKAADTLKGITYSRHIKPTGTRNVNDTVNIALPECIPVCCRPIVAMLTEGDKMSRKYPYIQPINEYRTLSGDSVHIPMETANHVHYAVNSALFEPEYMNNDATIDSITNIINSLLSDSNIVIESVQIVGYTAPDRNDETTPQLGYKRASSMRNHLQHRCNLPDSIFEIADGGKNWQQVYRDIAARRGNNSDSLLRMLKSEDNARKRLGILRRFDNGSHYKAISGDSSAMQRGACCTRIYYYNLPDSTAEGLNEIVTKLISEPNPDYDNLRERLKKYGNDPRAINIRGVIDYRQHRRHAAERSFIEAAMQGDEQAAINLEIMESLKE